MFRDRVLGEFLQVLTVSWWVYTIPSSTGTCERCKRSAAEHTWVCIACATARRPNARLAAGDQKSFSLHTYKDHVRMVNSSTPRCDCRRTRGFRPFLRPKPAR